MAFLTAQSENTAVGMRARGRDGKAVGIWFVLLLQVLWYFYFYFSNFVERTFMLLLLKQFGNKLFLLLILTYKIKVLVSPQECISFPYSTLSLTSYLRSVFLSHTLLYLSPLHYTLVLYAIDISRLHFAAFSFSALTSFHHSFHSDCA